MLSQGMMAPLVSFLWVSWRGVATVILSFILDLLCKSICIITLYRFGLVALFIKRSEILFQEKDSKYVAKALFPKKHSKYVHPVLC
jgi:hypothetical protein